MDAVLLLLPPYPRACRSTSPPPQGQRMTTEPWSSDLNHPCLFVCVKMWFLRRNAVLRLLKTVFFFLFMQHTVLEPSLPIETPRSRQVVSPLIQIFLKKLLEIHPVCFDCTQIFFFFILRHLRRTIVSLKTSRVDGAEQGQVCLSLQTVLQWVPCEK